MKKRKRILLIAGAAFIICGLALVLYISHESSEPVYQGKALSYWLTAYSSRQGQPAPKSDAADEAIRHMGTNCLPRLLRLLQRHDSPFKVKIRGLLHRQHFLNTRFFDPGQDFAAFRAMEQLGAAASNAVPELIHIFETDSSFFSKQAVPAILGAIGPAARRSVPMLLSAATHTNEVVRNNAIHALGQIHAEPDKVVPALMQCMKDPSAVIQAQAVKSLGHFGADGRPAIPALLELLRRKEAIPPPNPPQSVRTLPGIILSYSPVPSSSMAGFGPSDSEVIRITRDALKSIDPDAAAKAGIK